MSFLTIIQKAIIIPLDSLSILVTITLLVVYWKLCERSILLKLYTIYQVFVIFVVLAHIFSHLGFFHGISSLHFRFIKIFFYTFSQTFWVILCWTYLNPHKEFNKKLLYFLSIPALLSITLITNRFHHLYFNEHGERTLIGLYTNASFFMLMTLAMVYVLYRAIKETGHRKKRVKILIWMETSIAVFLIISFFTQYDYLPPATSISSIIFAVATFKFKIASLLPIAFKEFAESVNSSIIILDTSNEIVYKNNVFLHSFPFIHEHVKSAGSLIKEFLHYSDSKDSILKIQEAVFCKTITAFSIELSIKSIRENYYDVYIQPIKANDGEYLGKMIYFNEITKYKELLDTFKLKAIELENVNQELQARAEDIEKLTINEERKRISMNMHDIMGKTIISQLYLIEESIKELKQNHSSVEEKLRDIIETLKKGCTEIRESVVGNLDSKFSSKGFELIKETVEDYRQIGMEIDLSIQGSIPQLPGMYWEAIYYLIQESLTNSNRHGKAKEAYIIIRFGYTIKIYIFDTGSGSKKVKKGNGLSGMEERIKKIGGNICFNSGEKSGFYTNAEIPII